jgi:DivIVA domain-containing protein
LDTPVTSGQDSRADFVQAKGIQEGKISMEELIPASQDLARVEFATAMRGYDKDEVDTFLRELAEEQNRLVTELETAKRSAEKAHLELGEEIGDLLQHAKDVADQMVKKAEEQAAEIKEKTRRAADRTVAEAERRAEDLRRASENSAVTRIREAQEKVSSLETVEKEIRNHLYSLRKTIASLDEQLQTTQAESPIEQTILDDAGEILALSATAAPAEPVAATSPAPAQT